ncbi:hypothetical protein [Desertihabitans aurantiacus]|uniref:hypothetical protein n=1 Tax=Desertihabitans aurantiacus TaxID=2282477 RepID=UPI000DF76710|nr:hypothetical protein [Desertihabitans aurantiacus]
MLLLVTVTACSAEVSDAEVLASWSETEFGQSALEAVVPRGPGRVVQPEELPGLIAALPRTEESDRLQDPPDGAVVLVHGYQKCQQQRPHVDRQQGTVWFAVPEDDGDVYCAWAPYTVELWSVLEGTIGGPGPEVVEAPE